MNAMPKRRGKGEGTIYKRPDGTWIGQVTVGYDPVTGNWNTQSLAGDAAPANFFCPYGAR